jgi:glycosyltransferase involved in cell wall biosynthesis
MLEATVRSVRGQTYPSIEHIVVDGGSTDGTLELLARYEGSYPLRWLSGPDLGMYPAINKGLRLASGEIHGYLNSDDLYFPWTISVVTQAFANHPEVDVIYGDVVEVDDETLWSKIAWNLPFDLDYLRRSGFMWQPAVFWRRRVFDTLGGFDEAIRYGADLDYWFRLGEAGARFRKINEMLAVVRMHPQTLSLVHRAKVIDELAEMRAAHAPAPGRLRTWTRVRDRFRRPLWTHLYWALFIVQSLLPRPLRSAWSKFLNIGGAGVSYRALLLRPMPGLTRFRPRLFRPGRNWLEPLDKDG